MAGADSDNVSNGGFGGTPQDQPSWPGPSPFGGGQPTQPFDTQPDQPTPFGGGAPTQPFGAPDPSAPPFGSSGGFGGGQPTQPFGAPDQSGPSYGGGVPGGQPTQPFGAPSNPWQQQGAPGGQYYPQQPNPNDPNAFGPAASGGWQQGYGGYPGAQPGGQFPGQQPPKKGNGRFVAALLGSLAAVTAVGVTLLLVTGNHSGNSSPVADDSTATAPTASATPTDTSDATATATDTATDSSGDGSATSAAFDASEMDDSSTDPAPYSADALLPNTFTDSKNVEYTLQGAGTHDCVQDQMSSDVQSVMRKYGCSQVLTGSYTVSSGATSKNDILVSVEVFAFKDASTAHDVYNSFSENGSWDFGIWCPNSGDGAKPCDASSSQYDNATKSEVEVDDHRYLIEATALYTNMTTDSSVKAWTDAAVKEAAVSCGPEYYISTQD